MITQPTISEYAIGILGEENLQRQVDKFFDDIEERAKVVDKNNLADKVFANKDLPEVITALEKIKLKDTQMSESPIV